MPITFNENMVSYAVGRRGNMEEWNTISRTLETNVQLPFGAPVQRGTGEHGVVPFTSGQLLGITEANQVLPHPGDYYSQYDTVGVCEIGVIGVLVGTTGSTAGAVARWDTSAQRWVTGSVAGTVIAVPGAQFETTGPSGSVQLVRFRRAVPTS